MPKKHKHYKLPKVDVLPLVDCVFQLIIFFLMTIKSEQKLDDILKLPPAYKSVVQAEDKLQIYILKAAILPDGSINPDSTGLIAFTPKEPDKNDPRHAEAMYVKLEDVDARLKRELKRVVDDKVHEENYRRGREHLDSLKPAEVDSIRNRIPLMIKADAHTFYGRILQVVARARSIGINSFAIVTSAESSQEYTGKKDAKH